MTCVLDAGALKKLKISLEDYNYKEDLSLRALLHHASAHDIKTLEEILFSSIKTSEEKLLDALEIPLEDLKKALNKFESCGLVSQETDQIVINKDLRKYFELEIQRFEEDFEPGIEFLAQLFKKVPIHILPVWYALPRSSSNIFESIVEKYLQTPQLYQRLLSDAQTHEPHLRAIINLLYTSDYLELDLEFIMQKLQMEESALFETIAQLEFNLIACVKYVPHESSFKGILTPFHEYKSYLKHLRSTEAMTQNEDEIEKITLSPCDFIEGLFTLIKAFKAKQFNYPLDRSSEAELKEALAEAELSYLELEELMQKLLQVQLIDTKNGTINLNETSFSFISMKPESAALVLYRHPSNKPRFNLAISVDKAIRECEKAASRLVGKGWVLFDDFLSGCIAPLSEQQMITLKKNGRKWSYHLPVYSSQELEFINHLFLDWFEKVGVIEQGFLASKPVIKLTALGTEIFS